MQLKPRSKFTRVLAGGAIVAALGGGAVVLASASSASPDDTGRSPAAARLLGLSTHHFGLGAFSQFDLGDDAAAETRAVTAAGEAAIASLEGDGSIDATQAGQLRELLPRITDEVSAEADDDGLPDVVYDTAAVFGVSADELDQLVESGSASEFATALGIDEQSATDAAVAAALAGIDSLEADGALDTATAAMARVFAPGVVSDLVAGFFAD